MKLSDDEIDKLKKAFYEFFDVLRNPHDPDGVDLVDYLDYENNEFIIYQTYDKRGDPLDSSYVAKKVLKLIKDFKLDEYIDIENLEYDYLRFSLKKKLTSDILKGIYTVPFEKIMVNRYYKSCVLYIFSYDKKNNKVKYLEVNEKNKWAVVETGDCSFSDARYYIFGNKKSKYVLVRGLFAAEKIKIIK